MKAASHPARPSYSRSAGLLLHVTSLPGRFGIGDLGPAAHAWVDRLADSGQSWWQVLPLTPPTFDSPYTSLSAMAGNPMLISPEALVRAGWLGADELPPAMPGGSVDYPRAIVAKERMLDAAFERFRGRAGGWWRERLEGFATRNKAWLEDYALFMALRQAQGGAGWMAWSVGLRRRRREDLRAARRELDATVARQRFVQFVFHQQLADLRRHARRRGVRLIGDVPIFVAHDSADVWARPELFQLDRRLCAKAVAGVPPDHFSRDGQCWGNPLYNWRTMRAAGFDWWVERFRAALAQVDVVRIDHFRGFEAYWAVPAGAATARQGRWVRAPGRALFEAVRKALGPLPLIAEDLGVITPAVERLRAAFGLPGMRVLQFAFDGDPANAFLPHNYVRHCVAYTGTHDNDTLAGWYGSLAATERRRVDAYLRSAGEEGIHWAGLRAVWGSVADVAIAPAQELAGLGSAARMNVPGVGENNWRWRLRPGQLTARHWARLREMTELYNRLPRRGGAAAGRPRR